MTLTLPIVEESRLVKAIREERKDLDFDNQTEERQRVIIDHFTRLVMDAANGR